MSFVDTLLAAIQSLLANRLRSILTTLGIVIGIAAVIAMVSIGTGAQSQIQAIGQSLGTNLLFVRAQATNQGGVRTAIGGGAQTLTGADARAIAAEVPGVVVAAPSVDGQAQVRYVGENVSTQLNGVTPDFFVARDWLLASGRWLTDEDLRGAGKVVMLGETVARNLFGGIDPLGQTVQVNQVPMTVVGLLAPKGQSGMGWDQDDAIFVPLTTARQRLLGRRGLTGDTVTSIAVKAESPEAVAEAERGVTELLRQRHRIGEGEEDDFVVRNLSQQLAAMSAQAAIMTALLAAIASISLLVGGIGIMNIMLVSVTERTREIGLRMALGADRRAVLTQFVVEALVLSLIGGALGVALGVLAAWGIKQFPPIPSELSVDAIFLAFAFSAATGLFFGWYPAHKASRLDPIEALRFE